ncbi:unnamed protein product [Prorocentrum cordatum]|uniref:RRM domain-containing protein n=1 Tax=Prorocentrum cordatum TaxID=2364126 RepID=A0ABN9UNJ5_9DINO|nr:unnamed protein product [Polarella glacialis]
MDVDYDEDAAAAPSGRKVKGRGAAEDDRYAGKAGQFDTLGDDGESGGPARSIEGWVFEWSSIVVSGVHEEAQEDDVFEAFAEHGDIKNLHLNLDRRTGFVKGYAFIWVRDEAGGRGGDQGDGRHNAAGAAARGQLVVCQAGRPPPPQVSAPPPLTRAAQTGLEYLRRFVVCSIGVSSSIWAPGAL